MKQNKHLKTICWFCNRGNKLAGLFRNEVLFKIIFKEIIVTFRIKVRDKS